MKKIICFFSFLFMLGIPGRVFSQVPAAAPPSPRESLRMDSGWRFAFGHPFDPKKDFNHALGYFSYYAKTGYGDGAASKDFDDRAWRRVDLPHDWAAEMPFSDKAGYSHGYKTVGREFPETSVGWYRRTFFVPESDLGLRIALEFDGVHRDSRVWVNGFYVGEEHSGYAGFRYDITDVVNYGGTNVVAVRVDATMEEGWYYEGAGIYRHVRLVKTAPLHVPQYGIFVSSEVTGVSATVTAATTIVNAGTSEAVFNIDQAILNPDGTQAAGGGLNRLVLRSGVSGDFSCTILLENPRLWSVETPFLYRLVTTVRSAGSVVDRVETPFGVRTLRFDSNEGFFLNGKHVWLKGTNNHQDHAGVGTAIPDAVQEFRIARLKEMGSNAYRCSHNPPTPELLDACDRLGMLVIDENRLMGSNEEHLDLLRRMILRDRNHPSVLIWSMGNEEWAIEGNITGARIVASMQDFSRRLDPTRRITAGGSGGWGHGISTVLDVMGFNYIFNGDIDKQHRDFPDQPGIGTEETTSRSTRGVYADDPANAHLEATDRKPSGRSMETGLAFYAARPFLSGLFFWTGFDHRGEPNPFGWPQVGSQCGIVDQCGFPKDMFYYLKSWWTNSPVLHLLPHWNWKAGKSQEIRVWAYGNCDEVELFLNKKSCGRKTMPKMGHLEWTVNYAPGVLLARGFTKGRVVVIDRVETTGEPAAVRLSPDRASLQADGEDVSVITVRIADSKGRTVPTASNEIAFSIQGPGRIIGVGNGDPSSHEPDRFFERISQSKIEGLKTAAVRTKADYPETGIGYDDSNWRPALDGQGNYGVKTEDTLKTVVIRGTFGLSDLPEGTEFILWPKSLGQEQAVYVNGTLVAKNIRRGDDVQKYKLDRSILRPGRNIYALVGTPLVPRYRYDNLNTDPGIVQVVQPSPAWKRKVFNGLAQVIVQALKEQGEIILSASSVGLAKTDVRILTRACALRPSVPAELPDISTK